MAYPIGGLDIYDSLYEYSIAAQNPRPICYVAPECTLDYISGSTTAPTIRNGSDGTVSAVCSGATGATLTWYLNGIEITGQTGTTGATFTGLTTGTYYVTVVDGDCEAESPALFVPQGEFRTEAFNVVSEPFNLACVEKPIMLNLATATNTANPLASKSYFYVSGTIDDGDSIRIQLEYPFEIDLTFYAKGMPDRSTYFLTSVLDDGSTNNATEIATSIAEALSSTILNRIYYISSSGAYIYLQAKEFNEKLDLDSDNVTIDGNITITKTQSGIAQYDGSVTANYSLWVDLYVNQSLQYGDTSALTNYLKMASLELPYNNVNNQHKFDLAPILKNFVSTPKIDFNATSFFTLPSMHCSYYCVYGERYPLIQNSLTKKRRVKSQTTPKFVLNSSLPWEDDNDMTAFAGSYIHDVTADYNVSFNLGSDTISVTDYYFSTGTTGNSTDIQFKLVSTTPAETIDWQDSPDFTGLTATAYTGTIYVSGLTSGATFIYETDYYVHPYGSGYTNNSTNQIGNILFLTEQPSPLLMQRDSSKFEYMLLPKSFGRILKVKAERMEFYNGDVITGETLYQITTSANTNNIGAVFCLPSGYEQLNLENYENPTGSSVTRKIRRLDFAVYFVDDAGNDARLTEEKSYRFEIDQQPSRYEIAWLGLYGTWQTFSMIGEIVEGVQREVGTYEVPIEATNTGAYNAGFQKNTVYNTKLTKTVKCNSGWLDEAHRDYLISMLKSNRIYSINEGDENFLLVESVDQATKSTNDTLYQVNVTFKLTTYSNNVSV